MNFYNFFSKYFLINSFESVCSLILPVIISPFSSFCRAISNRRFSENFGAVIRNIGADPRCEVHSCVLGVRENKDGWLHLFAPGGLAANDLGETEGLLFTDIVSGAYYMIVSRAQPCDAKEGHVKRRR